MLGKIFWKTDKYHEEISGKKDFRAMLQYHELEDVLLDVLKRILLTSSVPKYSTTRFTSKEFGKIHKRNHPSKHSS